MQMLNVHFENLYSPYNGSIIITKNVKNLSKQSDYDNRVTEWQSNPNSKRL